MEDQARPAGDESVSDESVSDEPVSDKPVSDKPVSDKPAGDSTAVAAAGTSGPGTGDARVDATLRLLDRLPELPVAEHAPVFERVHAELTEVLGDLDPESAGTNG